MDAPIKVNNKGGVQGIGGQQSMSIGGGVSGSGASAKPAANGKDWRAESNAFREAMKAARQVTKAIAEGKPLPPPVISSVRDPSLIPCPHCGRYFNEKAGERHIPKCTSIKAKPTVLKAGSGKPGGVSGGPSQVIKNSGGKRF